MSEEARQALAPVRTRLLHEAWGEASQILTAARAEADAILRQARQSAAETLGRARAQGEAEGGPATAAERSRGREAARSIVLGARYAAYQELRAQVLAAADRLRAEPGYQELLGRLAAMATRAAGAGAAASVGPDGGVVARSDGVVVDCTLPRLADRAVDELGDQVRELWTP